ncbi:MAG: class I SAM-dependent methyltransferase [Acidimicrobiales bacterium]
MPASQFGDPRGPKGWLAAQVVARLTGEANRWMIDCLQVGPDGRVLDVGCGPGLAVAMAARATQGLVAGVDVSSTMVRHARRRNRTAVREGRVEIRLADAVRLPYPDGHFTRVGSLNSLQFWPLPDDGLRELYRVLAPNGRLVLVVMARRDDPPGPDAPPWLKETVDCLRAAGFATVATDSNRFGGVLHRALLAVRPAHSDADLGKGMAPPSTPRRTG